MVIEIALDQWADGSYVVIDAYQIRCAILSRNKNHAIIGFVKRFTKPPTTFQNLQAQIGQPRRWLFFLAVIPMLGFKVDGLWCKLVLIVGLCF